MAGRPLPTARGEGPLQLIAGLSSTIPVIAVDHEDQTLRVLKVVPAKPVMQDWSGPPGQRASTYNGQRFLV